MKENAKRRLVPVTLCAMIFQAAASFVVALPLKAPAHPLATVCGQYALAALAYWLLGHALRDEQGTGKKRALGRHASELAIGLYTAWIGYSGLQVTLFGNIPTDATGFLPTLVPVALTLACGFVLARFLHLSLASQASSYFRSAAKATCFTVLLLAASLAGAALNAGALPLAAALLGFVAAGATLLLGLEILVVLMLDLFSGQGARLAGTRALDSRLLGLLLREKGVRESLVATLHAQFGFEITKSTLLIHFVRCLPPLGSLALAAVLALTTIAQVEPHEQAVRLRFGRLLPGILEPGLHFKAPWPIDRIEKYDVTRVRRIHVGSHESDRASGEVYGADDAILWARMHGLRPENLLIVAPPRESEGALPESGDGSGTALSAEARRAPGIALMGGDIYIEYVISDLQKYLNAAENTDALLRQRAEETASRLLLLHDIDSLIGFGRTAVADELVSRLREISVAENLGLKVLYAGLNGFHPPVQVAESFHDTVISRQNKETAIQEAQAEATRIRIELTGSEEISNRLIAMVGDERNESLRAMDPLLLESDGKIAEAVSNALGYRVERETAEGNRAQSFLKKKILFETAPRFHSRSLYFGVLEEGLRDADKYVILSKPKDVVLRFEDK